MSAPWASTSRSIPDAPTDCRSTAPRCAYPGRPRHRAGRHVRPGGPRPGEGDPAARRRFLDQLLVQTSPDSPRSWPITTRPSNSATRCFDQRRRAAAASNGRPCSTLDVWNDRLVQFGADIVAGRIALLDRIAQPTSEAYSQVASTRNDVAMAYTAARLPDLSDDIGNACARRSTPSAVRNWPGRHLARTTPG